jgi:hypothetical protein
MSEIKVDTLTGKTTANDITVTVGASATAKLEQGLGKSWNHYNQSSETAVKDSFNVSSVTDDSTAQWITNFSNNMSNAFYTVTATSDKEVVDFHDVDLETGRYELISRNDAGSSGDADKNCSQVMGDLA